MDNKKKVGFLLVFFILIAMYLLPVAPGLTPAGQSTIGITVIFFILIVTEALPIGISSLLTVALMPLTGATSNFAGALVGFSHPVIFFILGSFAIAAAIMNVPITKRLLSFLISRGSLSVNRILLMMMITTAVLSLFMSNVPTVAIMMSIALEFINLIEEGEAKKSIAKTFMIAVPVATMIGGVSTPASSSLNLLAIGLLEQQTGVGIAFVHWMAVGIPVVVLLIPLAWFLMVRVYRPHPIPVKSIESYIQSIKVQKKIEKKEALVMVILSIMLILWILSSWVTGIDIFIVALLGSLLFFMPGINVLSWKDFLKTINWDIIFLSGAVLSIANAIVMHEVSIWLIDSFYPENLVLTTHLLLVISGIIVFAMALIVTSAPALITVMAVPLITMATISGVPPAYLLILLAFCAGNCYLLPLDTVQMITYSKGHYGMTDMARSTIFLQIAMVAILALWIPFIGGVLGF